MEDRSVVVAIQEFFDLDPEGEVKQLSRRREPFHRPATLILPDGSEHSVFTRDISREGLGMVHRCPVEAGPVQIEIQLSTANQVRVAAEVVWCGPCQDYYASGARFLEELRL